MLPLQWLYDLSDWWRKRSATHAGKKLTERIVERVQHSRRHYICSACDGTGNWSKYDDASGRAYVDDCWWCDGLGVVKYNT